MLVFTIAFILLVREVWTSLGAINVLISDEDYEIATFD